MPRYIDADAYIKYCADNCVPLNEYAVKAQPTVDVTPVVHAKLKNWRCTNCNMDLPPKNVKVRGEIVWQYAGEMNYCPNCGAKMEVE